MENQSFYLPHEKPIIECLKTIEHLKKQQPLNAKEIKKLEQELERVRRQVYGGLSTWDRILIARHPNRPHSIDYIRNSTDRFLELHGDRTCSDDPSVVGGFATIDGIKFVCVGQEKGSDTESRIHRNFGMVCPEGFRKALRLMELAEKYGLPVVSFLDTAGAHVGIEAEQRGQGWVIANNLLEMSQCQVPIIVVIIGEGASGGALGMGVGDVVGILEHAYYSVVTPEGCASIIWKDAAKKREAAEALKCTSEHLIELGVVDEVIPEPTGGAHHDPASAYKNVRNFILEKYHVLKRIDTPILLEHRYGRFRRMGQCGERKATCALEVQVGS